MPEETELLARQLTAGFMPAHLSIVEHDLSVEKSSPARKHLLISILVFLVVTLLSFFIFYRLNRR